MDNPYAPPSSAVGDIEQAVAAPLASGGQRFANYLLDGVFLFGLTMAAIFAIATLYGTQSAEWLEDDLSANLIGLAISIAYYAIPEALWGRTFAKFITKTKVLNEDGSPLSNGRAFGRSLIRMVPIEALSFLWTREGESGPRGWHDRWSGTKVIALNRRPIALTPTQVDEILNRV